MFHSIFETVMGAFTDMTVAWAMVFGFGALAASTAFIAWFCGAFNKYAVMAVGIMGAALVAIALFTGPMDTDVVCTGMLWWEECQRL